jgi:branched-chain amino acid transport system permease protein
MVEFVLAGLTTGAVYALIAYGYNVIFATTGVLNFAHGEIFMAGMMLGAVIAAATALPLLLVLVIAILAGTAIGAVEERLAIAPMRRRGAAGAMGWVLSTLGAAILIQSSFSLAFGPQLRAFPPLVSGDIEIAGATLDLERLVVILTALVVGIVLHLFYERTLLGRALGAVEQDSDAAAVRGIPVGGMATLAFAIGSGVAALTGFLTGSLSAASPTVGLEYGLKGFIVAAAGGIPSIKGATIAGLAIGLLEQAAIEFIGPGYRNAAVFAVLLIVLMVRPAGLYGKESVRAV